MTSVMGHLTASDFELRYQKWQDVDPRELFAAPIQTAVATNLATVSNNIKQEARAASKLFIWTDCDREGEHIGWEIAMVAKEANRRLSDRDIARAVFNNVEANHVRQAANRPQALDMKLVRAVEARIEVDLRIGAAFTRFQTMALQRAFRDLGSKVVSYGSCQFPTLGFVVDQYKRVKNFKPEKFWYLAVEVEIPPALRVTEVDEDTAIKLTTTGRNKKTAKGKSNGNKDVGNSRIKFLWERNHLFDHLATTVIFERCADTGYTARVASISTKPTSRYRPLPLTTVELQKLGSRFFGLSSKRIMDIAEALYNKGFISYPRTETDQFDKAMDLKQLVEKQTPSLDWGEYARGLLAPNGRYTPPRQGRNNDKAHPPIHPVMYLDRRAAQDNDHYEVYKFITRRFLACVSPDARGEQTTVVLDWADERFRATGLVVTERNFLEVYPYQKWTSSATQIPPGMFNSSGQPIELAAAELCEGTTSPPKYLTEPELISLMDLNGIGTDATMADHIDTILTREYVFKHQLGGAGSRTGRGRGRRSANTNGAADKNSDNNDSGGNLPVFIPSSLGIALVEGYDAIGFDMSLSKPFLRREMEESMRAIISGRQTKQQVVSETIRKYRDVYDTAERGTATLLGITRRYLNEAVGT
ncbi:hypothetical protein D0Z03_001798 [Geotrichum reessii]|nr:hypothetical protein D0Z03_001798 [Galactomyces reessii]